MENKPKFHPNPKLKLMDQTREVLRYHHYAYSTEKNYCHWILRYIYFFGGKTHPNTLGAKDVEGFLSHLATEGQVSAASQGQVLPALEFLCDTFHTCYLPGLIFNPLVILQLNQNPHPAAAQNILP